MGRGHIHKYPKATSVGRMFARAEKTPAGRAGRRRLPAEATKSEYSRERHRERTALCADCEWRS